MLHFYSLVFSLQDSMVDACAEGISDEHYRLEGKPFDVPCRPSLLTNLASISGEIMSGFDSCENLNKALAGISL